MALHCHTFRCNLAELRPVIARPLLSSNRNIRESFTRAWLETISPAASAGPNATRTIFDLASNFARCPAGQDYVNVKIRNLWVERSPSAAAI